MTSNLALHSFPCRRSLPPQLHSHGRRSRPRRSARRHGLNARRRRRHASARLQPERLEQRRLLAFDFVAAFAESPIPFFVAGNTTATPRLAEAPQQVTLRFDPGVQIDPTSIGGSVTFVRSGNGVLGDGNDVSVLPVAPVGSITVGDSPNDNEVVIRFAETLPDDVYRFTITSGLRSTSGDTATAYQFDVRLDLGAFVTAVVPQPVDRLPGGGLQHRRDQVDVYFNAGDPLNQSSAENPGQYRLVPVSAAGIDGVPVSPTGVTYTASTSKAILRFASNAIADGVLYRLEIGPTLVPTTPTPFSFVGSATDDNSSFVTATPLGTLGANGITATARIEDRPTVQTPAGTLPLPHQPGTIDEPGHRDTPADSGDHGLANLTTNPSWPIFWPSWVLNRPVDGPVGYYNFRSTYGFDGQGNALINTITETQKQRTREIFESFSRLTGIRFVEETRAPYVGLTVVTGDIRAIDPSSDPASGYSLTGSSRVGTGLFSRTIPVVVMNSSQNWGESEFGGAWAGQAMGAIGYNLGMKHSFDVPSIQGFGSFTETVFPGDYDAIHLKQLYATTGTDIDVYSFSVANRGRLSAETVAGRPGSTVTSLLDTVLSLYREDTVGTTTTRTLVARNDDYYGRDSFVGLDLEPGKYFIGVTSTGNDQFNPETADSGYGGRTRGPYELRLGFTPVPSPTNTIVDTRGTQIDGDRDGLPGGTNAFWFKTAAAADTVFVDKLGPATGADGTVAKPFKTISAALAAVNTANAAAPGSKKIVRIVGNNANTPYLIGTTLAGQALSDGATFNVPKGVTVMIDAGAIFKLRSAIIDVGSSQPLPTSSRAEAALQVLGVPGNAVTFTSYNDDSVGGNSDGLGSAAAGGQWGGLVFRQDSDAASKRAFVNAIQQADIRYGGGQVRVDSQVQSFAPIQIESTRPTIAFNTITDSAGAAIAATPNSFEESNGRIGPEIRGNRLTETRNDGPNNTPILHQNTTNGLFIKIFTRFGSPLEQLDVPARFKSTDIVYVLQENLVISGGAGGYTLDVASNRFASRPTGRLAFDAGVVVKLQNSRIELERGAGQLIAEGGEFNPVIFTSLGDNRYGAGGTFDTNGTLPDVRAAGDWGGIILNAGTRASIERAYVAFGGGLTPIEGTSDSFNVIEVHQADLRLANTRIEHNLSGLASSDRTGRGTNAAATVFIRGAQPIIVGNDFRENLGAVVSINVNSLSDLKRPDVGRSTGTIQRFDRHDDNVGPLVADNTVAESARVLASTSAISPTTSIGSAVATLFAVSLSRTSVVFTLVNGTGSDDNGLFTIAGNSLVLTATTPKNTLSIRVRASDLDGKIVESVLTLSVAGTFSYSFTNVAAANADQFLVSSSRVQKYTEAFTPGNNYWGPSANGSTGTLTYKFAFPLGTPSRISMKASTPTWDFTRESGGIGRGAAAVEVSKDGVAWTTLRNDVEPTVRFTTLSESWSIDGDLPSSVVGGTNLWLRIRLYADGATGGYTTAQFARSVPSATTPVFQIQGFWPSVASAQTSSTLYGMEVRAEELTVEGVWDDTSIVHVVKDELVVRNFHTATGLRLQSRPDASLVVKLLGTNAGITAEGYGLDIDDRIGGTVQIVGQPGHPVILTSLADDSVGASRDPSGRTVTDTANDSSIRPALPGDWRSLEFLPLSNDRNVSVYVEAERPLTSGREANAVVDDAEDLGVLAPNFATGTNSWESAQEKSGDDNRRLGFEVHGFVSPDDPTDVDVYAFQGYAGSEVWIDVDKTASRLDSMVELLDSFGNVLARSTDESVESSVTNDAVVDLTGGLGVTYQLTKTNVVQGTLVGTLFNAVTGLAIQDFSIDPNGTATFYDRLPASPFHATAAILNPVTGQVTFTFDNAASATGISASYVYATGALSAATLGLGQSAQRDGWRGGDYYTTNPRDPGMRVILPGTQGQYLRYYVRVRSQPRQDAATLAQFPGANAQERYEASLQSTTFDQPGDPSAGATSGSYELRIRLRQRDEKPGSVVRYADIRFPTVGIDVFGLPRNSLLTGETGETTQTNDTLGDAQYVGNLLESDRNTISVAGELGSATDVDWYQFALNYEQIVGAFGTPAWATVFDIDYADGFRGNLTLAVFDAAGTLLYIGRDSDIRDDQPGTSQGNDFDDLSRGSLGKLDPFIGTVQLPTGAPQGTRADPADPASQLKYYVAVMSNGQLPSQLNATFQTAAGNTLVRLEPITSLKRVVEDHIGFTGYTSQRLPVNQTTIDPNTGAPRPLIDISSKTTLDANVRAFTLADVTLFVSTATGLYTVDAVTGNRETSIRTGIPGVTIGDLDMRTDGKLYAYAGVNNDVNNAGQLIELDTGTGAFVSTSSDGIENVATTPLNFQTTSNTVTALAFRRTNVADYDDLWFIVQDGGDSKLYRAADGGSATTVANATADQTEATSTTLGYRGRLQGVVVTGLQFINDSGAPPTDDVFGVTADGQFITILAGGKVPTDTPDFQATLTPLANFTTQLQTVNATGFRGLAAAPRNLDNGSLSGMFVAVTNNGRLCVIDPVNNVLVPRLEWGPGPNGVGDLFSPAISGVTGITGLAFSPLDVNLWHATERRGDTDRDTVTTADAGHGINATSDKTRIPGDANRTSDFVDNTGTTTDSRTHSENLGGISMYFGLEEYQGNGTPAYLLTGTGRGQYGADPTWHEDLTANAAILNNYNLPGGAYGSLITNSFSLATYASTDNPTLYFNYWLETQGAQSKTDGMRDSARVLISVDQGITWQLLATNNSTRSAAQTTDAELPNVISASSAISAYSNQHVQELFDSANWRQARVDLAKWAGRPDIRLRFDFHTAGEFDRLQTDINGNLVNSISGLANTTGNFGTAERGQNNEFEGFYIDDIVVGLAERGEMVTSAVVDTSVSTVSAPPGAPAQSLQGPYQLEIRRGTEYSALINRSGDMQIFRTFDTNERLVPTAYSATGALRGDSNLPREQGQFVIDGNIITSAATYGISIDAGARDAVSNTPHPGVARNLPTLNNAGLVPGAVVVNNVVSSSGTAGIRFSGDPNTGSGPTAVVPYGRIINNTIYGGATAQGTGITVTDNAGPTLMNNLFANLATGVSVDASSQRDSAGNERTVVTHSGFSGVTTPVTGVTDRFRVTLPASPFVNAAGGNFYPVAGSPVIDSSLNSLQDRNEFLVVNSPIGVPPSPILAPEKDLYGQVRADDPGQTSSVPGLGLNAFKDLGAIDRVDFSQSPPYLVIIDPQDNGPADVDVDLDEVEFQGAAARNRASFSFQIIDGGAGIDPATVVASAFTLTRDGTLLVSGKDYVFRFTEAGNRVVFTAASVFKPGIYTVVAAATVTDRAGNPLRPNNTTTGATAFEIRLLDVPYAPAWPAPMSPLAPVTPLLAGWHEGTTIHLGWSAAFTVLPNLPIIQYDLEQSTDNFLTQTTVLPPTALTSLTLPNLTNGTPYWFRVRATNALGTGPWSDVIGPIVPQPKPSIALALDTGLSPTDGITRNGLVNVLGVATGAQWQYRLSGGTWTSGTGSSFLVPDGTYLANDVQVRQIVAGFPSVPATNAGQWIIDSTSPAAPVLASVSDDVVPVIGSITSGGFTNDRTPTFTGTAEAGTTLRITHTSGTPNTLIVPAGGTWTYTPPTLADGSYTFTFVTVDIAENESPTTTFRLTVDTIEPTIPVITSVNDNVSPVEGVIASGGFTNDPTPIFTGSAEAGTTLRITVTGGATTSIIVPADGIWTYTPTLANGSYSFTFVAVDAAGNESAAATFSVTVDTMSPARPVITSVVDDASPGVRPLSNGDTTNDAMPAFQGTAEPSATLRITANGSVWATITVPSDGIWAYTFTVLPDGPYAFTFVAIDAAGNESPAATFSLTIDTIAPLKPDITDVTDNVSPVTGSNATGGFTNDPTPTFNGTAEAGTTLRITRNSGTPTTLIVPAGGTWTYTPTLANGSHSFSFVAVDAAGNESPAATFSLTVDTIAPTTPVITSVNDDQPPVIGSITSGGITNDPTPTFTGTAEAGATLRITVTGSLPTSITVPASGVWTYTPNLTSGPYTFTFIAVDAAGNESPAATFSLTVDTIAPTTPVITSVTDNVSPVIGSITSGGFTNDSTPTFNGTADAGTTLRITRTSGTPTTITVPAGGIWTYTPPTLADGSYTFTFIAVDAAGNESPAATFSLTVDTVLPTTPVITSVTDNASPVTGSITSGGFTNDSTPAFTGTAEPNTTLRITVNSGTPTTITVPAGGTWTYTPTLSNGSYSFSFVAIDAAGNESPAATFSLTVDTVLPTTPVITSVTDNVSPVTGSIPSGGFTNDPTPTFTGTAEAGVTLRITVNSGTPTTITVPAGGTWTYTPTLSNGSHSFSFVAVDAAGNESPAATFSLTVDTIAPQIMSILADSPNGTYGMGQTIDIKVTFSEAVTVTGAPAIQLNTSPLRSAVYVSGSGTSVFLFRYTIQTGELSTRLDYTSTASLAGGSFPDAAGNPASLTLPAPGGFLGKNIVVDALIKATVSGLGQWPNEPPDFASAVSAFQVQFNTSVTGFTASSISLQRLADIADPTSGRPVSLAGVTITGSGASWTITLPSSTNPTSIKGRYKLVIGGFGSGIQAGGVAMDVPVEWYFDRI